MVRQWLDNGKTTDDYEILIHTKLQFSCLKYKKSGKTVPNVHCAVTVCTVNTFIVKKSVQECLPNPNSPLHTKNHLSSLKNKKVGKTVQMFALQNVHCVQPNCQKIQYT